MSQDSSTVYFTSQADKSTKHGHCLPLSINNIMQEEVLTPKILLNSLVHFRLKQKEKKWSSAGFGHTTLGWYKTQVVQHALQLAGYQLEKLPECRRRHRKLAGLDHGNFLVFGSNKTAPTTSHYIGVMCDKKLILDPDETEPQPLTAVNLYQRFEKIYIVFKIVKTNQDNNHENTENA